MSIATRAVAHALKPIERRHRLTVEKVVPDVDYSTHLHSDMHVKTAMRDRRGPGGNHAYSTSSASGGSI